MEGLNLLAFPTEVLDGFSSFMTAFELGKLLLIGNKALTTKLSLAIRRVLMTYGPGKHITWPLILVSSLTRLEHLKIAESRLISSQWRNEIVFADLSTLPSSLRSLEIGIPLSSCSFYQKSRYEPPPVTNRVVDLLSLDIPTRFPFLETLRIENISLDGLSDEMKSKFKEMPLTSLKVNALTSDNIIMLPKALKELKIKNIKQLRDFKVDNLTFLESLSFGSTIWGPLKDQLINSLPSSLTSLSLNIDRTTVSEIATLPRNLTFLKISSESYFPLISDSKEHPLDCLPPHLVHLSLEIITLDPILIKWLPRTLETLDVTPPTEVQIEENFDWTVLPPKLVEMSSSYFGLINPSKWHQIPRSLRRCTANMARHIGQTFRPVRVFISKHWQYLQHLPPSLERIHIDLDDYLIPIDIEENSKINDDEAEIMKNVDEEEVSKKIVLPPQLRYITIQSKGERDAKLSSIIISAIKRDAIYARISIVAAFGPSEKMHPIIDFQSDSSDLNPKWFDRIESLCCVGVNIIPEQWLKSLPERLEILGLFSIGGTEGMPPGSILRYLPPSLTQLSIHLSNIGPGDLTTLPRGLQILEIDCPVQNATYPWSDVLQLPYSLARQYLPLKPNTDEDWDWVHKMTPLFPSLLLPIRLSDSFGNLVSMKQEGRI